MEDLVSIIVPIYNVEKYLVRCVDSILNQDYGNIEIILIDDGSTDRSGEMANEYAEMNDNVTVIHQRNQGLSVARNRGIDEANGKWLSMVDSDDYLSEKYVSKMVEAATKTNADLVICGYSNVTENDEKVRDNIVPSMTVTQNNFWDEFYSRKYEGAVFAVAWNKLYSRHIFESGLRYKARIENEDDEIIYRLISKSHRITFVPTSLYAYRSRPGSIMTVQSTKMKPNISALEIYNERTNSFTEHGDIKHARSNLMLSAWLLTEEYRYSGLYTEHDLKQLQSYKNKLMQQYIRLFKKMGLKNTKVRMYLKFPRLIISIKKAINR